MDAPAWNRSDGQVRVSIRNLGAATAGNGRSGHRLRLQMDLNQGTRASDVRPGQGVWKLDLIVDAEAGELLALHEFEAGEDRPTVTTITDLELVPAAKASSRPSSSTGRSRRQEGRVLRI